MRPRRNLTLAAVGLLVATSLSSCHVKNDPVAYQKMQEKTFLDILSGPLRDKYSDADLIAEGHKACEAFSRGKSSDQVADMVETDLNLDPGSVGQFMGGLYGGLDCNDR
jgi:hypothetical protein